MCTNSRHLHQLFSYWKLLIIMKHKLIMENWQKYLITEAEQESSESVTLKIPKFRISEQWGTPGSHDREIIEMFTSKIHGQTLGEKIASLNSFVTECDAGCAATKDVSEILANLIFLDALASVIYDFNPMTGGFLFESLISALLGGPSMQVPTSGGINQDVTDIIDHNGRPMSLKFFFKTGSGYIKGSYNNLRRSIVANGRPMIYLVGIKNRAHKEGEVLSIDFYEFSVGARSEGIKGDFDASEVGGHYGLSRGQVTKKYYHIGTLGFGSRKEIQQIAANYTERLGSIMLNIYKQIDELSLNINKYFLNSPEAKDSALKAQANAVALKQGTEELA